MALSKNERKILIKVNNEKYITELAKECDINNSNAVIVVHRLENKGLIYFRLSKGKKYVMLTEEGDNAKELIIKLDDQMR